MKVAIVTAWYPSAPAPYTGAPLFAQMPFLKELAEIRVFCPRSTYPPLKILRPRKYLHRPAANGYDLAGAEARHLTYLTLPFIGRALNGSSCGKAVFDAVREFSPDVILAYNVYPEGYGAVRVGRRLNIPVVLFAIGSDVRYIADSMQKRLAGSALRRAAYVLAVSHELRDRAIDLGASPQASGTILNGCNTNIFRLRDRAEMRRKLAVPPDAKEIVFVGRLLPLKGLRELFDALAIVRRRMRNAELTCIGEGPLGEELAARALQDDLQGAVRFIPQASPEEIAEWMGAADITCLPSYTEGCPNAIVESLACGRAAVGTNVGGIPELLNDSNGIMVRSHDVADLARGVEEAFSRNWDEAAISAASQRSWQEVAEETIDVCREVVASYGTGTRKS
jgi:teichuronic acid biosynthesis glycosyltransferase TuaC